MKMDKDVKTAAMKDYIAAVFQMRKALSEFGIKKSKRIKTLINLFLFKKIPYVEVAITTRCTLKCKDCANYIPDIKESDHYMMSFEEFKLYLDNLLQDIQKVHKLVLLGGEPLLNKDLPKILEYSLAHKKIRKVKLVTNGTMDIPDDLLRIIKQYTKPVFSKMLSKIRVFISNYSINKEISGRLKIEQICNKMKSLSIPSSSMKTTTWYPVSPIKLYHRSKQEDRKNFLLCPFQCVSITAKNLYVCPRAAFFDMYDICHQEAGVEYLDLSKPVSQKDLLNFYSNTNWAACAYCNMCEDVKKEVMPALQRQN